MHDICLMKDNLRQDDINEIWASSHFLPEACLLHGYLFSSIKMTILKGGEPIAMFGVVPYEKAACVWLLGTSGIDDVKKSFMKASRPMVDLMLGDFDFIYNYVDDRYKRAIKWIEWCGAKFNEPLPYGEEKLPFRYFEIRRKYV